MQTEEKTLYQLDGVKHGDMIVYALHPDGSESVVDNDKQFDRHAENGGMFAVDKEDWMRYLENGEYLRTTEISTEQNFNMIDGRRNNIVDHAQKSRQKIKEKHRPNWEASHYYANEDGESYRSREYT